MGSTVTAAPGGLDASARPERIHTFEVHKDAIGETRWVEEVLPRAADLEPGAILMAIEKFAMTANNVSYAVAGDRLGYWDYFPSGEEAWGRLPAFGFGEVVASRCSEVPAGAHFYGYFPMASHVRMRPAAVTGRTFVDHLGRREALHESYNTYYAWTASRGERADLFPALNPLFMTSWLYFNHLVQQAYFGAEQVILIGASSKTATALSYFLSRAQTGRRACVALTSQANVEFVSRLGCFDQVLAYGEAERLLPVESIVVDFAGNGAAVEEVHRRLGDLIKVSSRIGQTHWSAERAPRDMPGPRTRLFFAPSHVQEEVAIWGEEAFHERADQAWSGFLAAAGQWFAVEGGHGAGAVEAVYRSFLEGRVDPSRAHVMSVGG